MVRSEASVPRRRQHLGFRLEEDLLVRTEAIGAALAAQQPLLPPPDRSTVMRAIVAAGIEALETRLRLTPLSPPSMPVPTSKKRAKRTSR
jgi:hypothetical protein